MNKPRAPLGLASKVWALVEEPKTITLIQVVWVYFGAVVFGALATFYPPRTTSVVLGDWSVTAITLAMVFAGLVGIVTATFGVWWVERLLAIGVLFIAGALYIYSVGEAQVLGEGNRWLQLGWVWTALGGLVTRYIRIRKSNYDPVT